MLTTLKLFRTPRPMPSLSTVRRLPSGLAQTLRIACSQPRALTDLIALRRATAAFLSAMYASTRNMPFGVRYVAREVFRSLRDKFPNEPEHDVLRVAGHVVYYRFIQPAIVYVFAVSSLQSIARKLTMPNATPQRARDVRHHRRSRTTRPTTEPRRSVQDAQPDLSRTSLWTRSAILDGHERLHRGERDSILEVDLRRYAALPLRFPALDV